MYVKETHQILSGIKKDAHKRKVVPFFLPHGAYCCGFWYKITV